MEKAWPDCWRFVYPGLLALVALLMPGDGVTRLIAVLTFLMVVGGKAYDIWKKEAETRECVKVTPELTSYESLQAVGVELYNAGSTPLTIKRVALVIKTDTGEVSEFMPSESEADRLENSYYLEASSLPESVSRLELGPKKHARFRLDRHTERMVDWFLKQPSETFWIVVESFIRQGTSWYAKVLRAHWRIENNLHWQLDISFNEDSSRIQQRCGAASFALLRKMALSLIKQNPTKYSIARKRKAAALDTDYLAEILAGAMKLEKV